MRRKGYYLFYMLLLLVDIISDSEVVQFSPEERYTTKLVNTLIYTWYTCVAVSWAIFLHEIFITYYSFKQTKSETSDQNDVLDNMKIVHQALVMLVEDILICFAGVWLGVIVPGESLSGTVNQVSICITLVSCLFQYVMVFHRSCVYFREQKVQPIEYCSCTKLAIHRRAIWLFVLLASSALSLAVMKSFYVFPTFVPSIAALWNPEVDPSSFAESNRHSSTTPSIVSSFSNSTTEKTDRYSDQAVYLYIYLIGPLIVLYIISGVILSTIRCCCIQQKVLCSDFSIQKCFCICCCNRLS